MIPTPSINQSKELEAMSVPQGEARSAKALDGEANFSTNGSPLVESADVEEDVSEDAFERQATGPARLGDKGRLMDYEKGIIGWDSEDDPQNPLNWSTRQKALLMTMMCCITTLSPLASTMMAPATRITMAEFHENSQVLGSFMITIFVLGWAVGPLVLSPLSEIYGRYPVVVSTCWFFNAWILGCSFAPNLGALIFMRLLAGIGGSAVMTIAPAIAGDLFPVERRGFATSVIIAVQCLAPSVGPICGSFISAYLGWRWSYWILLIASGLATICLTFFMRESNTPILLQRKAKRLEAAAAENGLRRTLSNPGFTNNSQREVLGRGLIRPLKLLFKSPVVALISIWVATNYGILYLLFTTIPMVFNGKYGWSLQMTGLAYVPLGIGMMISLLVVMKTNDATVIRLSIKNGKKYEPEMRLPDCIYYAVCIPIALFWYGWTTDKQVHWISPIIALGVFGFGMLGIFMPPIAYMIDAFPTYAASAVAAIAFVRCVAGTFLPLAGPPLYSSLGLGWGNMLLGFIAAALIPIPLGFYKYGGRLRNRFSVEL